MLTLSIISMLFIANGDSTPYNHWKSEREEIMTWQWPNLLLCLVERGDRLAEAGHAQVGGVEAQLGGGHLGQQLFRIRAAPGGRSGGVWTRSNKFTLVAYLVFATCRQVSLRKAILSSGLSTINCTTYLGRQEMVPRASQLSWKPYILSRRSSVSLQTIATRLLVAWTLTFWKI